MKEQTAVEWLVSEIRKLAHNDKHHLGMGDVRITQGMLDELEEQAKEKEKERMLECYLKADVFPRKYEFEKWYNETYKGGQDE